MHGGMIWTFSRHFQTPKRVKKRREITVMKEWVKPLYIGSLCRRWTYPKTFFRFRERVIWCLPAGVQLFYIYSILGSDRSHNPESALPLPIVDETASRQFIFSTFSFSAHQSHWHKQVFPFLRWFPCKWTEFNKKMNNAMWQSFRLGAVFIFCHGSGVGGQQMLKNHNEGHVHDFL